MVDIFSKYTYVTPVENKTVEAVLPAIKKALKNMPDHKPTYIYSDMESAFLSKETQQYFKDNDITHLLSLNHAPYAERYIRTIKAMIYKRLEHYSRTGGSLDWKEVLTRVLITFNEVKKSSVTKLTPSEAGEPKNREKVLMQLELKRKTTHSDPPLKVGDKVKIYKKKKTFDKERVPVWSPEIYTITEIVDYPMNPHKEEQLPQKLYKVTGVKYPLQRAHLLRVASA
jgi:hypothetical protein